ncbi:Linalool 8-monooxygenase [Sphingobium chlorophenolicum L-1]|uniref:Linalool 8-monooxygenase n=1 Tax=Sphingobium chlorophenolicum L-1 TaxID=690566 RepID=F6EZA0_SPHCR|nr:cytochrome P450 [Sphingobium chlorophenolicum]AEG50193.1 Linalool 8-monooxygenase [Sphingobium chlorophenolicum L-1]
MTELNTLPADSPSNVIPIDYDIFDDAIRADPFPIYREIRDSGPVCALTRHDVFGVARHAEAKSILENWADFSSASGVTMNSITNEVMNGSLLQSDPPVHTQMRKVVMRPLAPSQLSGLRGRLTELTRERVAQLKGKGPIEIVGQLATLLPLSVVSELVGLPEEGRDNMLDWANASFNTVAPVGHPRADAGFSVIEGMVKYLTDPSLPSRLRPGSWAAGLWSEVEAGEISPDDFSSVVQAYVMPSLDTTIYGMGNLIWLLASNPDQWALLKSQPALIPRCINEALRLEAPVLGFVRQATRDVEVSGIAIPEGARLMMLLGAANRDERRYENPDLFDIQRDARDHLAFGAGIHRCAGGNLAMLELATVLEELVKQIDHLELVSELRSDNLGLRGFSEIEMVLH